jgi:chloramphenicol 3-O phosphotransferase
VSGTEFDIILDCVLLDKKELDATLRTLAIRLLYVIGVSTPLAVLEERERTRDDRAAGMAREQYGHPVFARTCDLEIDTSTCSPAEAAAVIRAFAHGGGV